MWLTITVTWLTFIFFVCETMAEKSYWKSYRTIRSNVNRHISAIYSSNITSVPEDASNIDISNVTDSDNNTDLENALLSDRLF